MLGDYGEVIVLDWGLAKLKGADEPQPSVLPVSVAKESSREATIQGQAPGDAFVYAARAGRRAPRPGG